MSALRSLARALPLLLMPVAAAAQQNVALSGDALIYDLAGQVRLQAGTGSAVAVQVRALGADAGKLKVVSGPAGSWQTLRVVFPDDDIVYAPLGRHSETNLDVRENGTFGDEGFWREEGGAGGEALTGAHSRRVHITGDGGGLQAYADLVVQVPAGRRVALFLGVGKVVAENVDGRLRVSTASGDVSFTGVRGAARIATGSGDVTLANGTGEVIARTGSGDVSVQGARGGALTLHTGSGDVTGGSLAATKLQVHTGSGDIKLSGVTATGADVQTGSGDINLGLSASPDSLRVSAGSGDVHLTLPAGIGARLRATTGSGDIDSALPVSMTRQRRGVVEGTLGDGKGSITVSTGSGDIQLIKG